MAKKVKYLKQVVSHLENRYGKARAQAIMEMALKRYEELIEENAGEPKEYYMHTRQRIYPCRIDEMFRNYYENKRRNTKYVAWKLMSSENDEWPKLNEATDDFPCVFRGMSLPNTEDNFLNFLRNRKMVSFKLIETCI